MFHFIAIIYSTTPGLHNDLRRTGKPTVLVQLICQEKIQMSNCHLPKYTLQNTKIYNITSYQSIHYWIFAMSIFETGIFRILTFLMMELYPPKCELFVFNSSIPTLNLMN
jgi:hypothetical protein